MTHFTKMALVDVHTLDKLNKKSLFKSTNVKAVEELDGEMSQILSDKNLSAEQKVLRYNDTLGRFREFYNKVKQPNSPKPSSEVVDKQEEDMERQFLNNVPMASKKKLGFLLTLLKRSGRINWTPTGELSIDGTKVPRANVYDILQETASNRRTSSTTAGMIHS